MSDTSVFVTKLNQGQRFTAVVTGTRNGERFYRPQQFVSSRDQDVEQFFIPARPDDGKLAQDRVFVEHDLYKSSSVPVLVVTGSIKALA